MSVREYAQALRYANKVLDRHDLDPDGDECMLARSFIRLFERAVHAGMSHTNPHPNLEHRAADSRAREQLLHDVLGAADAAGHSMERYAQGRT